MMISKGRHLKKSSIIFYTGHGAHRMDTLYSMYVTLKEYERNMSI